MTESLPMRNKILFLILPINRKTKLLTAIALLLIFFPCLPAPGIEEPEDFRGIKWGDHIDTVPGMNKIGTQENIDIYKKENDKLQIGGTWVQNIEYYFYKHRFMGLHITFEGFFNFSALKKWMFNAYGPGKKKNYFLDNYNWLTSSLLITLNYTNSTNSGFILYCYLPLWNEKTADEEKANQFEQ